MKTKLPMFVCAWLATTASYAEVLVEASGLWVFPVVDNEVVSGGIQRRDLEDTPGVNLFGGYRFEGTLEGLTVGLDFAWFSTEGNLSDTISPGDALEFNEDAPKELRDEFGPLSPNGQVADRINYDERFDFLTTTVAAEYAVEVSDWLEFYLGLGAGYGVVRHDARFSVSYDSELVPGQARDSESVSGTDVDTVFAYNLDAGARTFFLENWSLHVGFKFLGYSDLDFEYGGDMPDIRVEEVKAYNLQTGIGYRF